MATTMYQEVLLKIQEATGGNDKRVIDIVSIIKREGFGGHVEDICDYMSREGWIAEATSREKVYLTSWGHAELKRMKSAGPAADSDTLKAAASRARQAAEKAHELSELLTEYAGSVTQPHLDEQTTEMLASIARKASALKESVAALNTGKKT